MSGVRYYTLATLEIPFPEGKINCWNCPVFYRGRQQCMATGEMIQDAMQTGSYCALKFPVKEADEFGCAELEMIEVKESNDEQS